uniref:Ig-like domain-containing protein n=1 Tax=Denticeps clupeoides TaxID=299321 RepID=A0AAY4BX12_9TELE
MPDKAQLVRKEYARELLSARLKKKYFVQCVCVLDSSVILFKQVGLQLLLKGGGKKTTLFCDISRFYPEQLDVVWLQKNGSQVTSADGDICTGLPAQNQNHTFNLRSQITVQGVQAKNDGAVYICQVRHRTFPQPCRKHKRVYFSCILWRSCCK